MLTSLRVIHKKTRQTFFVDIDTSCSTVMDLTPYDSGIRVILHLNTGNSVRVYVAFFEISHSVPKMRIYSKRI